MTVPKQNFVQAVRERVAEVVVGQDTVVERMMVALLTGGHLLLIGVPGIGENDEGPPAPGAGTARFPGGPGS